VKYAHTNLVARDWQRLARFYEDVFGCVRVPPERHLSGESIARGTGIPGARLDGVHLRLPGLASDGPTLEVFQYGASVDAPIPTPNRVGFGHIAFAVDDVNAAREAVLAAGGTPVGSVEVVVLAGAGTITWTYVRDPEGNIIELQHRDSEATRAPDKARATNISTDLFDAVPGRTGHFVLESGYHTDRWLTLDLLFSEPARVEPAVAALAERLRRYDVAAVCGPFIGGALLAQWLATVLQCGFYFAEPETAAAHGGLFTAVYRLSSATQRAIRGRRVAVVDEVISAGSSVRATIAALDAAGATTVVAASLATLGDEASTYFDSRGLPCETLARRTFTLWKPDRCPLCEQGIALEDPTQSRSR
jgi:orotate phosphoribosyltransferase/catechol 2,3-dioxygenase-like lactoylglutathione lyase family enzyme